MREATSWHSIQLGPATLVETMFVEGAKSSAITAEPAVEDASRKKQRRR